MSQHPPQEGSQPPRDREVVVTNGGSGSNLGTGIIVGLLIVIVAVGLIWFFTSGSDDGGIDVPDTLELDVDVDGADTDTTDGADGADGTDGADGADGTDGADADDGGEEG